MRNVVKELMVDMINQGEDHYKAKLTVNDVKNIRFMLSVGVNEEEIAEYYGVTKPNIYSIKRGRSWKHVS